MSAQPHIRQALVPSTRAYRWLSVATLVAGAAYFGWRATTLNPVAPVLSGVVFALEFSLFLMGLLSMNGLWRRLRRDSTPLARLDPPLPPARWPTVDVLIPCMTEPLDVLERTVRAALALDYPAERLTVYVLDDAARPEAAELVARLAAGAPARCRYVAREKRPGVPHHAKAGNLNHALFEAGSAGELVAFFDSDQVAHPSFLQKLVPYFFDLDGGAYRDNRVAFVQTPDSPWNIPEGDPLGSANRVFYGPMQEAADGAGAPILTGSNVLMRRRALEDIGGFFVGSVTEDVPTGFALLAKGWEARFHSQWLARGMAPEDLPSVLRQRLRWLEGSFQVLLQLDWSMVGRLRPSQRVELLRMVVFGQIFGALIVVFTATMLASSYWFGASFLVCDPYEYVRYFVPYFALSRVLLFVSYSGVPAEALYRLEQQPIYQAPLAALALLRALFLGSKLPFWVTPKQRSERRVSRLAMPSLLLALAFVAGIAWVTYLLASYGSTALVVFLPSLLWMGHFVICLWPVVRFSVQRAQRGGVLTFDEPPRRPDSFFHRLFLPTNIAGLLMLFLVIGRYGVERALPRAHSDVLGQRFDQPLDGDTLVPMQFLGFQGNEACFSADALAADGGTLHLGVREGRRFCDGRFHRFVAGGVSTTAPVGPDFEVRCRLKPSAATGVVTNCATWGVDPSSETSTWASVVGGRGEVLDVGYRTRAGMFHRVLPLGFDATAGFHDFGIEFGGGLVRWRVDGRVVFASEQLVPAPRQWASVSAWPSSAYAGAPDAVAGWSGASAEVEAFFVEGRP